MWSDITPNAHHFEQAYSDDGGTTWQPIFIANLTRKSTPPSEPQAVATNASSASPQAGDFDFDLGSWKIHTVRLVYPLSGSKTWTTIDGITVVRPVWGGRGNLAEVESDGPLGHLELLALRLYNPESHEWNLTFATSRVGTATFPMTGTFAQGRGVFYDQEPYRGHTIFVRFRVWPVSARENRSEQAFSPDGGKTWETNWINTYTRVGQTR